MASVAVWYSRVNLYRIGENVQVYAWNRHWKEFGKSNMGNFNFNINNTVPKIIPHENVKWKPDGKYYICKFVYI